MSTIRLERDTLDQIKSALEQYRELLKVLDQTSVLKENTKKTYLLQSEKLVRWLSGDWGPGERNRV